MEYIFPSLGLSFAGGTIVFATMFELLCCLGMLPKGLYVQANWDCRELCTCLTYTLPKLVLVMPRLTTLGIRANKQSACRLNLKFYFQSTNITQSQIFPVLEFLIKG
jgi:hypothetical protein